jgi:hypothetical protein
VVIVEAADEGELERGIFGRMRVRARFASLSGSHSPAMRASIIARPDTPSRR